jgi:serine/threonine protein kinase
MPPEATPTVRTVGRYALYDEIAAGGMATVHLARLVGPAGFSRTVAIKRLYPQYARDPEFVSMFLDEARIAGRIQHPNVVATLDVVALEGELFLVMEYVHGESLSRLLRQVARRDEYIPVSMAVAVMHGVARGLHAAHEARSESGELLGIVHRDVSPQNILLGGDGVSRVLDFGIAKAVGRLQTTRDGQLKGKTAYMAPEQLRGRRVDRRTDVFAAGVVLWEALAGERLFHAESPGETMARVLEMPIDPPSQRSAARRNTIPAALDAVVIRALSRDPAARHDTALDLALALEAAYPHIPNAREVGEYVQTASGASLAERARRVRDIESGSGPDGGGPADEARHDHASPSSPSSLREPAEPHSPSEVSSISVETPDTRKPRRSRWTIPLLAGGGMAVALGAWIAGYVEAQGTNAAPAVAPGDPSPPAAAASIPASSTASAVATSPEPTGAPALARPTRPHTDRGPRRLAAPSKSASAPACSPPYTIDPDGVHIPKPECD